MIQLVIMNSLSSFICFCNAPNMTLIYCERCVFLHFDINKKAAIIQFAAFSIIYLTRSGIEIILPNSVNQNFLD